MVNGGKMSKVYDAIVVGGGPAGTAFAKVLVGEGLKTLILEKKRLPRHKCCSGILFSNSKELSEGIFGKIPQACLGGTIAGSLAFLDNCTPAVPYQFGLEKRCRRDRYNRFGGRSLTTGLWENQAQRSWMG
jgi:choline dehydrogenase-like flavoprotein